MSTPEISQVLAQMRSMQVQATQNNNVAETTAAQGNFGDLLKQSINMVNETQQASSALKTSFETGADNVDLAQVMVASQKANVSFQAMVEVRNKLVDAYKDVMNMPI